MDVYPLLPGPFPGTDLFTDQPGFPDKRRPLSEGHLPSWASEATVLTAQLSFQTQPAQPPLLVPLNSHPSVPGTPFQKLRWLFLLNLQNTESSYSHPLSLDHGATVPLRKGHALVASLLGEVAISDSSTTEKRKNLAAESLMRPPAAPKRLTSTKKSKPDCWGVAEGTHRSPWSRVWKPQASGVSCLGSCLTTMAV